MQEDLLNQEPGETKTSEKFFAKGTKDRNIISHLAGRHREEKMWTLIQ